MPLLRPWRAAEYPSQDSANAAWAERVEALAAALDLQHDQSCTDTSRLFFLPRRLRGAPQPEWVIIEGSPCDLFALPTPSSGLFGAKSAGNGSGSGSGKAHTNNDAHEFIDPDTGEVFELRDWAREYGIDFLIADALRARQPGVLTGHIADRIKVHCRCPNEDAHTQAGQDAATFVVNAGSGGNAGFVVHCRHAHCTGLDRLAFMRMMLERNWVSITDLTAPELLIVQPKPNSADTAAEPTPSDGDGRTHAGPNDAPVLFDPWAELQPPDFPIDALPPSSGPSQRTVHAS